MTIKLAIEGVMDLVGAVSGIRKAPDEPPEDFNAFPVAVAWPGMTRHTYTAGSASQQRLSLFEIVLQVHVARKDLPRDYASLIPFADSVPNAIMNDQTFGGIVDTFDHIEVSELGEMAWGAIKTIGYEFRIIDVKLRTSVT